MTGEKVEDEKYRKLSHYLRKHSNLSPLATALRGVGEKMRHSVVCGQVDISRGARHSALLTS